MYVLNRGCQALAAIALVASAHTLHAQGAEAPRDSANAVCYGFAFGAWTPALDWKAAGHGARPDSSALANAPDGRDWAATQTAGRDTTLMLFPGWWPAGVVVTLPRVAPAPGDTLSGTATALVADGRVASPRAKVRAWRVPCGSVAKPD